MTLAERLVADFEQEAARTRAVLEAVPDDKLEWSPHEKSMNLGRLAGHVAECPAWTVSMLEGDVDFASPEAAAYQPFVARNRTELLEHFEQARKQFGESLAGRDDEFLGSLWTARHGEAVLIQGPRHEVMRTIALHHVAHHRGQLTVYLRLLDVPVPPTYGPTADDPTGF